MTNLAIAYSIARHSLVENYKNRFFSLFIIFAGVLIYASLLAGVMAVDEEARMLTDQGLALMELITLAYAVLAAASAITREIETKTIYLVFSRPVSRPAYLAGKAGGLYAASALMLGVLALIGLSLIYFRGFALPPFYLKAVFFIWCKLLIIISAALLIYLSPLPRFPPLPFQASSGRWATSPRRRSSWSPSLPAPRRWRSSRSRISSPTSSFSTRAISARRRPLRRSRVSWPPICCCGWRVRICFRFCCSERGNFK